MKWFRNYSNEERFQHVMKEFPNCPVSVEVVILLRNLAASFEDVRAHLRMIAEGYDPVFETPERSAELFLYRLQPSSSAEQRTPELSQIGSILKKVESKVLVKWLVNGGARQLLDSLKK